MYFTLHRVRERHCERERVRDLQSPLAIGTTVPQSLRPTMTLSALSTNVTNELNYDLSKEPGSQRKHCHFLSQPQTSAHYHSADKTKYNE